MTYCLAINVNEGLVFCSAPRTDSGTDNASVYSKMHTFSWPGERFFVLPRPATWPRPRPW